MDGISSSVSLSTLKLPPLYQPPRDFHPYKPHPQFPPSTSKRNSFSSDTLKPLNPVSSSSSPRLPPQFHRKPATGYAAALLDIALCKNSLDSVQKGVRKLSRVLGNEQIRAFLNDSLVSVEQKGELLKEVAGKAKLDKYLQRFVTMLTQKHKLEIIGEVLKEFQKIYDELSIGKPPLLLDIA